MRFSDLHFCTSKQTIKMKLRSGKVINGKVVDGNHFTQNPPGKNWIIKLTMLLKEAQNCSGIERVSVVQEIYTIVYDNKETIKSDPEYKRLMTTMLQKSSEHIASLNLLFSEMIKNTSYNKLNKTRATSLDTYANCMAEILRVRTYFESK